MTHGYLIRTKKWIEDCIPVNRWLSLNQDERRGDQLGYRLISLPKAHHRKDCKRVFQSYCRLEIEILDSSDPYPSGIVVYTTSRLIDERYTMAHCCGIKRM
ncbi:hypothetical protein TNCV_107131 [Trichonephila clavipes]|nr:hypothetical protein TNCV_107131 [Trichonephila clavipes]